MAGTSTLDPDNFPTNDPRKSTKKDDPKSLGPSDSSDSGSDLAAEDVTDDNSDRNGTGERSAAGKEPRTAADSDIDTDRVIDASEAGLGGGLDQAEEAQLGVTDEELERTADSAEVEVTSRKKGAKGAKATGHRKQPVVRRS